MDAHRQFLHGKIQLLRKIAEVAEGDGLDGSHSVLRVWRTVSRENRDLADWVFRIPSFAEHVTLRCTSPTAADTKLDFYTEKVNFDFQHSVSPAHMRQ